MRKDIGIHISTGDVTFAIKGNNSIYPFKWIKSPDEKELRYIYGEVEIPASIKEKVIIDAGICVSIPYTPCHKEIRLRIKRIYGNEYDTCLKNPVDGTEWFVVKSIVYGALERNIYASELISISESTYCLKIDDGIIRLYSGYNTDLNIVNANTQNKNLLLACNPGNNYRYPLAGVGLIRWTNSNIDISNLAIVLQQEFSEDGTPVINAAYNHELRHLNLTLDTTTVDSDGDIQS